MCVFFELEFFMSGISTSWLIEFVDVVFSFWGAGSSVSGEWSRAWFWACTNCIVLHCM